MSSEKTYSGRVAFTMQLLPGNETEYQKRHDEIWPELSLLLKEAGIGEYSIFLDSATGRLFAIHTLKEEHTLDHLPDHPIMKKWWAYMADLMETYPDNRPKTIALQEVFYLK